MITTPVQTWRTKALYGALGSAPYSANGALVAYYLVRLRAPYSANVPSRVRAIVEPSLLGTLPTPLIGVLSTWGGTIEGF